MGRLQQPDERASITFRLPADQKEQFDNSVESMSESLREHVADVVDDEPDDDPAAAIGDDVLRNGYRALRNAADIHDYHGRRLDVDEATAAVAEATKVPSKAVKTRVFTPLEKIGLIAPKWGSVVVRHPDEANL